VSIISDRTPPDASPAARLVRHLRAAAVLYSIVLGCNVAALLIGVYVLGLYAGGAR
jgi:hypothetical protein